MFHLGRKVAAFVAPLMVIVALAAPSIASAVEPRVKSDCPSGKICLWAGPTFGGQQSFWSASETGCHALENIDPQSVFNNTSNRTAVFFVGVFGEVELGVGPGGTEHFSSYERGFCIR